MAELFKSPYATVAKTGSYNDLADSPILFISEDMVTVTTDITKGVAPYSTSYGYTNITVNLDKSLLYEGLMIVPLIDTTLVVNSNYRNVRIRFSEDDTWHPVMGTSSILSGSSYFVKTNFRFYQYRTSYRSEGAFHLLTDSNSTYSTYSLGIGYGTCSTAGATLAKVVTHASYTLVVGGINAVKFDNAVPANATLNVNSKGAKPIYYKNSAITSNVISAGDIALFVYTTTPISTGCYELLSVNTWGEDVPDWSEITGKPDAYPPETHTHSQYLTEHQSLDNYVQTTDSRLTDARDPKSHTHTKSEITDFPSIPAEVTESTVSDWGFTKNTGNSNLALGETSTTAYRGDRGKTAYDHSQSAHAPSDAQKNVQSDWNATNGDSLILNKPDTFTPSSHEHTVSEISDFPSIPTDTADLTNGAGFLTEHQSLAGYVQTSDSRLSDARTPTSHTHTKSEISDLSFLTDDEVQLIYDSATV